jgi:hypothetical protein
MSGVMWVMRYQVQLLRRCRLNADTEQDSVRQPVVGSNNRTRGTDKGSTVPL